MSRQLEEALRVHIFLLETRKMLKRGLKEVPEWLFYSKQGGYQDINNIRK
jgi:hypothetical protein